MRHRTDKDLALLTGIDHGVWKPPQEHTPEFAIDWLPHAGLPREVGEHALQVWNDITEAREAFS